MKIEVANCRTPKYKMQRTISQLIIMLASANKQKARTNRKHFRAIGINFEGGRENPEVERGHKYFLAPPDSHIFSPYFRVPKRGHYFFMSQCHTLWTLRLDTSSKNMCFPRQRNWMAVVYDARDCVSLTARGMATYVHEHNSSFLRFIQVPLMLLAKHLRGPEWASRRDPSRTTRKI